MEVVTYIIMMGDDSNDMVVRYVYQNGNLRDTIDALKDEFALRPEELADLSIYRVSGQKFVQVSMTYQITY